jgi:DNA-binding Lrp family transcriptional regulator
MDDLDRRLILELVENAEQSNADLSLKLSVSEKTIRRRMSHLLEKGMLTRAFIPDLAKLGYTVRVFVALEVELSSIDKAIESLIGCTNVDFVALCTGHTDILLGAWFSSSEEMQYFVKNYLAKIPGIRKSETSVALDVKINRSANIASFQKTAKQYGAG